jgi:fatty-acyl-CoA synthase
MPPREGTPLDSTMQDCPLTVTGLFEHGEALHSRVLLRVFDGHQVKGVPYGQVAERVRRLGGALQAAGIRPGDRVGTLMWNTQPHLEAYFAAPCIGAVLHTVNPRLFPDQIGEILDDAEDSVLLVDTSLWASTAGLVAARKSVQLVLAGPGAAELAETSELPVPVVEYERFVASGGTAKFPAVDERSAASMCYTSGTTGKPKGVVYSHRSVYLHSMANCMASAFGVGDDRDVAARGRRESTSLGRCRAHLGLADEDRPSRPGRRRPPRG